MKKTILSTVTAVILTGLTANAGKVYSLNTGETLPLSDGSVVACMGTSAPQTPQVPQPMPVRHSYTCIHNFQYGLQGRENPDICTAVDSAIVACKSYIEQNPGLGDYHQWCSKNGNPMRSGFTGVSCQDETGAAVDISTCRNSW